jgi:hypothetical protein
MRKPILNSKEIKAFMKIFPSSDSELNCQKSLFKKKLQGLMFWLIFLISLIIIDSGTIKFYFGSSIELNFQKIYITIFLLQSFVLMWMLFLGYKSHLGTIIVTTIIFVLGMLLFWNSFIVSGNDLNRTPLLIN